MNISIEQLKERKERGEPMVVIDVRSPGEFGAGHIPGAVNIPLEEIESRIDDMTGRCPVVLVCQSGHRASIACDVLRQRIPSAEVVAGGTAAWAAARLPLVRSVRTRISVQRQVHLVIGIAILSGMYLGTTVASAWLLLAAVPGLGLTFAGLTGICPLAIFIAAMPWNRAAARPAKEALSQ